MVTAKSQEGAILITVISALAILAAVAHLLATQQGMLNSRFSRQKNQVTAQYVAEAGLRAALLRTRKSAPPYPVINGTLSGIGSYQAIITPNSGASPVTIRSTGTAGDATMTLVGSYPILCAGKGSSTKLITTYDSKGAPHNITENDSSNVQSGFHHPRNNTNNRSRTLIKFDLNSVPKAVTIISARLTLNVLQHDPSMEGGNLLVNRVITAWESSRADWLSNVGAKTRWSTPGGDFTLVGEAQATIAAGAISYDWEIASFVDGWVNGKFSDGHNGLIIRADRATILGSGTELRLKRNVGSTPPSQIPRLEVVHCNP